MSVKAVKARAAWGPWVYESEANRLVHAETQYDIWMGRCGTSAEVLDWIMQITNKAWADERTVAGLCRALNDLLCPQATLCSNGLERGPVDWSDLGSK
jgi:hypothetical protein